MGRGGVLLFQKLKHGCWLLSILCNADAQVFNLGYRKRWAAAELLRSSLRIFARRSARGLRARAARGAHHFLSERVAGFHLFACRRPPGLYGALRSFLRAAFLHPRCLDKFLEDVFPGGGLVKGHILAGHILLDSESYSYVSHQVLRQGQHTTLAFVIAH